MHEALAAMARACDQALGGRSLDRSVEIVGRGSLVSRFPVTALAVASIASAGAALRDLCEEAFASRPAMTVDRRLASFWFHSSVRPLGWTIPGPWDPIAGDYRCRDGWIRLHTNAPLHRAAAERVLGAHADKEAMARAVAPWGKSELEQAVVDAGGCAAEMRSITEWASHPQGQAVAAEPLVQRQTWPATTSGWPPRFDPARPLAGVRVLDLTRVLAGPVASRFLAGYGAEVLRIDPPLWDEPAVVAEVAVGKRLARLDLRSSTGQARLRELLRQADLLLLGYRADALDRLGFGPAERAAMAPDLVEVAIDAYGWSGPWAARRGFDSLVQMSSGIADAGMQWRHADKPHPLPVQALDHATGYLMAAAAVRGIRQRRHGTIERSRLSLARTAKLLVDCEHLASDDEPLAAETDEDRAPDIERTGWGEARRLRPPLVIEGVPMRWDLPARPLGSDPAAFL